MTEPLPIAGGVLGDIPYLRAHPGAAAFRRRAERLRELAPGHPAGDFLALVAALAAAQAEAAGSLRLPGAAPEPGPRRPLDASSPAEPWRDVLAALVRSVATAPMPAEAREAVASLSGRRAAELDPLAARVLGGELAAADLSAAPFVGAALQVVYAGMAERVPLATVPRSADATCPVCGFLPVAGVVLPAGDKLRYLVCALCGSQWHHTRLQCVLCRSAAKVSYLSVEGVASPARAEVCDDCQAYTKLLDQEKAPALEPFADDLASIALDILVAERGYQRIGRSPYLATAAG
jgi:FdhE protein